jgi:hypothetical protein
MHEAFQIFNDENKYNMHGFFSAGETMHEMTDISI